MANAFLRGELLRRATRVRFPSPRPMSFPFSVAVQLHPNSADSLVCPRNTGRQKKATIASTIKAVKAMGIATTRPMRHLRKVSRRCGVEFLQPLGALYGFSSIPAIRPRQSSVANYSPNNCRNGIPAALANRRSIEIAGSAPHATADHNRLWSRRLSPTIFCD